MSILKFLTKITGKKQQPETRKVQVDIKYTESKVCPKNFYQPAAIELDTEKETNS
ncbi:hypothetical protein [Thalassomonas sp. M1454]|uniref:hypothetical protein n=1 Tax=Thalassomonas sp. M1454 TaxID=2594477 RepID=UPI00163DB72F|nr:hypothetical protein [Thalassomonas sp. M1454]